MSYARQGCRWIFVALVALVAATLAAPSDGVAQKVSIEPLDGDRHAGEFVVPLNKSQILRLDVPFTDLSIGNPEIADVLPLTNRTVYVLGRALGTTNLLIYGQNKSLLAVVDVVVTYDIEGLKARLFELMPDEKIEVRAAGEALVLSGVLSSEEHVSRVLAVAERLAPQKVTNLMSVKGSQQVMLAVRFAEITRTAVKELGINATYGTTGTLFGAATTFNAATGLGILTGVPFGAAVLNILSENLQITLSALERKGLVKTLAEPNLVAMSGDTASFLAGGEFPIPVPSENGITIEFKEFGVGLAFTPTVLDEDRINLIVAPEVSALDRSIAVAIAGGTVPGLTTRKATTTIELRDGQTFAIAGLIRNDITNNISQLPWLGDVPVLGALFRSSEFNRNETELVIFVTPHLVNPALPGQLKLPTDSYVPPSEIEFFLLGRPESVHSGTSRGGAGVKAAGGGIEGPYGYILK